MVPFGLLLVSLLVLRGLGALGVEPLSDWRNAAACALAVGLILLLIAMFPANVAAARKGVPLRGRPPTPLPLRLSLQLVFIGMTWWATQT